MDNFKSRPLFCFCMIFFIWFCYRGGKSSISIATFIYYDCMPLPVFRISPPPWHYLTGEVTHAYVTHHIYFCGSKKFTLSGSNKLQAFLSTSGFTMSCRHLRCKEYHINYSMLQGSINMDTFDAYFAHVSTVG